MKKETLLALGAAAGPIYVVVGVAQMLLRAGFDPRLHPLSLMSNGSLGWIQVTNFLVSGALVILGALGVRRALHPGRAGTWGPILLALYGVGLIGAGVFKADPAMGFPPGTPLEGTGMSTGGLLHFVFGGIGFCSMIAACFVLARRFAGLKQRSWVAYSIITGAGFFLAFGAVASGNTSPAAMLGLGFAILWVWIWHAALHLALRR